MSSYEVKCSHFIGIKLHRLKMEVKTIETIAFGYILVKWSILNLLTPATLSRLRAARAVHPVWWLCVGGRPWICKSIRTIISSYMYIIIQHRKGKELSAESQPVHCLCQVGKF